ncbi:hypothetical protein PVAP13_3KG457000 [Panicum virgatum]|uniref:Uncharacterized protein n=1 Tax=Panicum virgatum TaxID=38727 RepID=A0A8T0UZ29_PANVG|nr:hypothetical protein PVAP13_3KG457000 [Panicum virgatum]
MPLRSPVSVPAVVARATATAAAAFRGRPVPVAALTSLPSVTVSSTSSACRQAPCGRHQGHQTDVVEAAVGSLQPDRCGGANDPMQSDPLPFPAIRAVGESRRHTAFLALSPPCPSLASSPPHLSPPPARCDRAVDVRLDLRSPSSEPCLPHARGACPRLPPSPPPARCS